MADEATITALRRITIKNKPSDGQGNKPLTFKHLKALVDMAAASDFPDDALIVGPQNTTGVTQLSVQVGE